MKTLVPLLKKTFFTEYIAEVLLKILFKKVGFQIFRLAIVDELERVLLKVYIG